METITLAATVAAFFGLGTGPSDVAQGPQWLTCATVDKGGYSNFTDPTCPVVERDGIGEEARQAADRGAMAK